MKSYMKKAAAALAVAGVAVSLAACSNGNNADNYDEAKYQEVADKIKKQF